MGTWGVGLYANDTALDVRGAYRDCRKMGFGGDDLADLVLEIVGIGASTSDEESAIARLALADLLWKDGMLSSTMQQAALDLTKHPALLARWEDGASQRKQSKVLNALAAKLSSAQRPAVLRKSVYIEQSDLEVGEILAFPYPDGEWTLLRVVAHYTKFRGISPIVEVLDWEGAVIPERSVIERLSFRKQEDIPIIGSAMPEQVASLIEAGRLLPGSTWQDFEDQMVAPYIPVIRASERDPHFHKVARLGIKAPLTRPFLSHWYVATSAWTTWKELPARLAAYFEEWPEDDFEEWPDI